MSWRRLAGRIIRVTSRLVPHHLRGEWRREWEAEIAASPGAFRLAWRSLVSVFDAIALRRHEWTLDAFGQDVRYAFRTFRRRPAFAAVVVGTLTLGIGANAAIFSVVNGVLLRPLPYPEPDRLMMLWSLNTLTGRGRVVTTAPDFRAWREEATVFAGLAGYTRQAHNLADDGRPERVTGAGTWYTFFSTLGVQPAHGRAFLAEDNEAHREPTVILSHQLWMRRYGGRPDLVGDRIVLDGTPRTVIGIMPPGFDYPEGTDLWTPWIPDPDASRHFRLLHVIGRLRSGVSPEEAAAEMETIAARLERAFPESNEGWTVGVYPLHAEIVRPVEGTLLVLFGAVGFVLLIACANVANLALARNMDRSRELAVRAALGARRMRLVGQLLTESVVLALVGGVLGVLVGRWGVAATVALGPTELVPRVQAIGVDTRVVLFAITASIVTGLLFGLAPVVQMSRFDLLRGLKEGGRSAAGAASAQRLRRALVIAEVAVAVVLVVGAGLLTRTMWRLGAVDPGFRPENVLTLQVSVPRDAYSDRNALIRYYDRMLEAVAVVPGVAAVGLSQWLPPDWGGQVYFRPANVEYERGSDIPLAHFRSVNADYAVALGIEMLRGRYLLQTDRADSLALTVINQTAARQLWPDADPIGKDVVAGARMRLRVVGIMRDVRNLGPGAETQPEFHYPYWQFPAPYHGVAIRVAGEPRAVLSAVQQAIWSVDPASTVSDVRTMSERLASSVGAQRFGLTVMGAFAILALVLAAVGIYGVVGYAVSQRRHEFGLRMALGASRGTILSAVVRESMVTFAVGLGLGVTAAALLTRFLASLLFQTSPYDPLTFAVVLLIMLGVAVLATLVPARRASRLDPLVALRDE